MPEWSKGPDSSKICFLKNSRFLVDNVCVGSNPTFSNFFCQREDARISKIAYE